MLQIHDAQFEAASLYGLRDLVLELGGDPQAVERRCQYKLDDLASGKPLHFHTYSALLSAAAEQTDCPHFGLLLGQGADLSVLGTLGLLTRNCATLGAACRIFMRYFNIVSTGAVFRLERGPEMSILIREPTIPELIPCVQTQDLSLSEAAIIARQLLGDKWQPTGIYLIHEPHNQAIYQSVFGCPVYFRQPLQGMSFPTSTLDLPLLAADDTSRQVLENQVMEFARKRAKSFTQRIRDGIKLSLATGDCGVRQVADSVAMHPRTVHRKLREEGTTFTELLEETRRELSYHLVSRTGLTVTDISQTLAYGDATAFSRSFRRWFGKSPASWRRHQ